MLICGNKILSLHIKAIENEEEIYIVGIAVPNGSVWCAYTASLHPTYSLPMRL